jgi:hypothetical protein
MTSEQDENAHGTTVDTDSDLEIIDKIPDSETFVASCDSVL